VTRLPIPHDYHMHSAFSVDSQVPLGDRPAQALALGLREICITDHCDFTPLEPSRGYYRPADYFAALERAREEFDGRITLRAGVEIGEWHQFPEEAESLARAYPYDFIIGSLHWVNDHDVMQPPYFEGRTEREVYEAYYTELLKMVDHGGFDVIGHLDIPKRHGFTVYGRYSDVEFEEVIRAILRRAIEQGIGIEINTGTARRPVGTFSPTLDVLRWYRELGGEIITTGSDSHRPVDMAYRFEELPAILAAAGFSAITGFERRIPYFVDLGS
jgi:histidinol-phosphatase (PHP family)